MVTKVLTVVKSRGAKDKSPIPRIRIGGEWLVPLGFTIDRFVSICYRDKLIELQLEKPTIGFSRIRSKDGFLKISREKKQVSGFYPVITLMGYWLNDIGFTINSVAVVKSDIGKITLHLIKCDEL